ncbi:hypothetical protein [Verrucomicrobium sp. BvORR034]|uniref:hypothetical protein n=1 Tax=Verrucomicrobium sp. BvORR034 TaxID=1396418 RepID=UPI000679D8D7|nr:hypothetical protein [Verrucomicrobium sp. BvORR034]
MKKLFTSLLALLGIASSAQSQQSIQSIDPSKILFSIPTLSEDIAELEPVKQAPGKDACMFHEDEWTQVEFFAKSQLTEVQRLLKEYNQFEQANRVKHGWLKPYIRRIKRTSVIKGASPVEVLEKLLERKAGPGPILLSSSTVAGRVKDGFSLALGGNVTLYGYSDAEGTPVLGAHVGKDGEDIKLTQVFMKLNAAEGLILVDWRAQIILTAVTASGQIDVWRP